MPGLTIGWEYLTGYYVATNSAKRDRAEWPPHPGRVFMALAAAWFETGEDADEGHALRWLESLDDPQLLLPDDSLIYCEGYALFKNGSLPTLHAWVTDGKGRAIDTTWPQPGVAYAGVPFQTFFVNMTALKNQATISLLDDYQNNWPLGGDLGDRPHEWLEPRGRGTRKVAEG